MTLADLQAAALNRLVERSAIARKANAALQACDRAGYDAIRATMPAEHVSFGRVSVCAIVPQNRTMYRAKHVRHQYWVDGKKASEAEAAAALA